MRGLKRDFLTGVRVFTFLLIITGGIYPLTVSIIAQLVMSRSANGSIIAIGDRAVGSSIIGQRFIRDIYFWGRPSHSDYHTLPSSGSNLSPSSILLREQVEKRRLSLLQAHPTSSTAHLPSELLYASGSGLDPHITPEGAYYQVARVAAARNISTAEVRRLVVELIEQPKLKIIGIPCVNVLKLNIALDERYPPGAK